MLLLLQAGNDFLPNVPSIDIYDKPCGLDLLFTAYKALLPKMGGHITGVRVALEFLSSLNVARTCIMHSLQGARARGPIWGVLLLTTQGHVLHKRDSWGACICV